MKNNWTLEDEERAERETTREMLRGAIKVDLLKKRFKISLAANVVMGIIVIGLLVF